MDKTTFEQLYLTLLPGLYRLARSILHSDADAQDAVQQAAVNAWQAVDRLRAGSEKAYIMRILIHECRNIQRQRMRAVPTADFPDCAKELPDNTLREALDALPEKLRLPLLLKYMEGWSERDIAAVLHITGYAVKSRLRRGRVMLATALKEEDTL